VAILGAAAADTEPTIKRMAANDGVRGGEGAVGGDLPSGNATGDRNGSIKMSSALRGPIGDPWRGQGAAPAVGFVMATVRGLPFSCQDI
jgi:hypothetical protein